MPVGLLDDPEGSDITSFSEAGTKRGGFDRGSLLAFAQNTAQLRAGSDAEEVL